MGKFSRPQIDDIFFFFSIIILPSKYDLIYHVICSQGKKNKKKNKMSLLL